MNIIEIVDIIYDIDIIIYYFCLCQHTETHSIHLILWLLAAFFEEKIHLNRYFYC